MGRRLFRWMLMLAMLATQSCADESTLRPDAVRRVVVPPTQSETLALLEAGQFAELDQRFSAIQRSYEIGYITDEDLRTAFRVFYTTDATLEQKYATWITQFPKSYVARIARAIYYVKVGELKRGSALISDTSEEQLSGMQAAFSQASQDLDVSVRLDAKPILTYAQQMDIARYLGNHASARAILEAANKVDVNNLIVRAKYMGTLYPRWVVARRRSMRFWKSPSELDSLLHTCARWRE
jgi:hypothetical protein